MPYTVVVGVDGSEHGDAALRWALAEAEAHPGGQVTAVFSWQLPFVGSMILLGVGMVLSLRMHPERKFAARLAAA